MDFRVTLLQIRAPMVGDSFMRTKHLLLPHIAGSVKFNLPQERLSMNVDLFAELLLTFEWNASVGSSTRDGNSHTNRFDHPTPAWVEYFIPISIVVRNLHCHISATQRSARNAFLRTESPNNGKPKSSFEATVFSDGKPFGLFSRSRVVRILVRTSL